MLVDILILSSLRKGPMHGYELRRHVQRPTFARLGNSSLYPALRRFELDGAVTHELQEQDGKPSRKVYTITDAGRAEFRRLIASLPADLAVNEEEFLVRVSFFGEMTAIERLAILSAREAVVDARIAQVVALIEGRPTAEEGDWPSRATGQMLLRLHSERDWIRVLRTEQERPTEHEE